MTITSAATAPRGNVVGVDPHKRTLSASVLDERGALLGHAHFRVSGEGHRELERWALSFGPVRRFGVEGAGGLGRHTAIFLALSAGQDVRDVCANRTATRSRARGQGRSDVLDAERIARETLAHADLPMPFKRAPGEAGPDEAHELIRLWHNARRSLLKSRQHLLNECEGLIGALPERLRVGLPDTKAVRPRLAALGCRRPRALAAPDALRLRLLAEHAREIAHLDRREREAAKELERLIGASGSSLGALPGLAARSVAELLVEVGDPRRFTEGGFARFNASAPVPASSGERGVSPHTIASYRDTFELLLGYAETRTGRTPSALRLADLDAPLILDFLDHLEIERANAPRTRNLRLTAIRSFMRYASLRAPDQMAVTERVLAISPKRFDRPALEFLTRDEVQALLAAPDRTRWSGRRDTILLTVLYNSGARVSDLPPVQWSRVSRVLRQQGGFPCPAATPLRSAARSWSSPAPARRWPRSRRPSG